MNFLTPDDLNALIELVESNNQYNDEMIKSSGMMC